MTLTDQELEETVIARPRAFRAYLLEKIASSLHETESSIEDAWREEVEVRISAIRRGEMELIDVDEVNRRVEVRCDTKILVENYEPRRL